MIKDVQNNKIFVKTTEDLQLNNGGTTLISTGDPFLDEMVTEFRIERIYRTFPHCLSPVPGGTDLSHIYTFIAPDPTSIPALIERLSASNIVRYANPSVDYKPCVEYNDPYTDEQWGLDIIQAAAAHEITTGDPSAIVAIIDTGLDMDHPDLLANIWINPGEDINVDGRITDEDINGRDDDDNGQIDDFHGWDWYEGDNDPNDDHDQGGHGTHCAGIASAVSNNEEGIASIGYSCSIMAVRVGNPEVFQVEEIVSGMEYAVRAGADVINCSFGGYQDVDVMHDVVNYCRDNNVLVVGAAGNDDTDNLHYPAAYENCLAVAATGGRDQPEDMRAYFSNYGEWVDVAAPGYNIRSTDRAGSYRLRRGTSMSCPFVAGLAVLIRAGYPDITAEQMWDLIVDQADNIEEQNDEEYQGLLGSGRINAYATMNELMSHLVPQIAINPSQIVFNDLEIGNVDEQALTIHNDGQSDLIILDAVMDGDYFTVEFPEVVRIPSQESEELTISFEPQELGDFAGILTLMSNDPQHGALSVELSGGTHLRNQTINLLEGWNLISANINPVDEFYAEDENRGPSVVLMTEQLRIDENNHNLLLIKDEDGRFYFPEFGFNNIPFWDLTQGYYIKVQRETEISWSGEPLAADTEIPIQRGWNFIAYFPTYLLNADSPDFYVLSPIIEQIEIAKNDMGQFMSPQLNFSNMDPWQAGRGFQIKSTADVVFAYPAQAIERLMQGQSPLRRLDQAGED